MRTWRRSSMMAIAAVGQSWGLRQIVQSPGSISIFYDLGQGQGNSRFWESSQEV
jgi:hypothetical protein